MRLCHLLQIVWVGEIITKFNEFSHIFSADLGWWTPGWGWTQYIGFENLFRCTPSHASLDISTGGPVVPYFIIALNHSIISPLCLVWVRAPFWPHVRQAKFCLRVCQMFFLVVLPFSPHLLIGPSISYELK